MKGKQPQQGQEEQGNTHMPQIIQETMATKAISSKVISAPTQHLIGSMET